MSHYGSGGEALSIFQGEPATHLALIDKSMELGQWFEHLHREYTDNQWGFETSMFAGLLQLSVSIARLVKHIPDSADTQTSRLGRTELLVEKLARETGMSRRHFIRLFRQLTGIGFSDYLQHKRVEFACRLILENHHKIDCVSKNTSCRDLANFREVFRKLMRTSPNNYQRGLKKRLEVGHY